MLALQTQAGNAAVSRLLLQRQEDEEPLGGVSPEVVDSFRRPEDASRRNFGEVDQSRGMNVRDPDADLSQQFRGEVGGVDRQGIFQAEGRFEVAEQDMYVVRIGSGGPGAWGYYPFRDLAEAQSHARAMAVEYEADPSRVRQELALPDSWHGSGGPSPAQRDFISVFRLPQGHPFITSVVAPQPEGGDIAAGEAPRTYRGGGLQVQFTREQGLDPVPLLQIRVRPTTAADMLSDPPQRVPRPGEAALRTTSSGRVTEGSSAVRAEWHHEQTRVGQEGDPTVTTESTAGVDIGPNSSQFSATRSTRTQYDEHVTGTSSHEATLNGEGQVGYTRTRGTEVDGVGSSTSAGGNASLGNTGIEGLGGSVGRSSSERRSDGGSNTRSVTISGGYTVDITEPQRRPDGTYAVAGTITATAALGGAMTRGSRGGSGRLSAAHGERFQRVFPDEASARAFYEGETGYAGLAQLAAFDGLEGATDLAVGESVGETEQFGAGVSATGGTAYLQAGLSFDIQGSLTVDIERTSETVVQATIRSKAGMTLGASLNSIGVGVGLSGGHAEITGAVIEYRIDQEAGRRALESFIETQVPPDATRGAGWTVRERITEGYENTDTTSMSAGVSVSSTGTHTVEQVLDADGNESVRATGRRDDSFGTVLPDWIDALIGASASRSTELRTQSGQGATLTLEIDAASAAGANQQLAEVIGAYRDLTVTGVDGGKWRLRAQLTEQQFTALVRDVVLDTREARNANAWLLTQFDRGRSLRRELIAINHIDDARVHLTEFVSDLGPKGAAYIRRIVGNISWDVQLQGSAAFTGSEGRQSIRQELSRTIDGLTSDSVDESVVDRLRRLLAEERQRHQRMDAEGRELPEELRAQQRTEQAELVAEIRGALADARSALAARTRTSQEEETADVAVTEAAEAMLMSGQPRESTMEGHQERVARITRGRAERQRARAAMQGDLDRAREKNLEQRGPRGEVWRELQLLNRGVAYSWEPNTPREQLSSILGFIGGEDDALDRIDAAWPSGEAHRRRGEVQLEAARDAASAVTGDGLSPTEAAYVDEARRSSWHAHDEFAAALAVWRQLESEFRGLRRRNPRIDAFRIKAFGTGR